MPSAIFSSSDCTCSCAWLANNWRFPHSQWLFAPALPSAARVPARATALSRARPDSAPFHPASPRACSQVPRAPSRVRSRFVTSTRACCRLASNLRQFVRRAARAGIFQVRLSGEQIGPRLRQLRSHIGNVERENFLSAMHRLPFCSHHLRDKRGKLRARHVRSDRLHFAVASDRLADVLARHASQSRRPAAAGAAQSRRQPTRRVPRSAVRTIFFGLLFSAIIGRGSERSLPLEMQNCSRPLPACLCEERLVPQSRITGC